MFSILIPTHKEQISFTHEVLLQKSVLEMWIIAVLSQTSAHGWATSTYPLKAQESTLILVCSSMGSLARPSPLSAVILPSCPNPEIDTVQQFEAIAGPPGYALSNRTLCQHCLWSHCRPAAVQRNFCLRIEHIRVHATPENILSGVPRVGLHWV